MVSRLQIAPEARRDPLEQPPVAQPGDAFQHRALDRVDVAHRGMILVRPDGYVACEAHEGDGASAIASVP